MSSLLSHPAARWLPVGTHALVRGVPDSMAKHALRGHGPPAAVDMEAARRQHRGYVDALRAAGVAVVEVPADERLPDCVFVEDTVVAVGRDAVVCRPGAPSRQGEPAAVRDALRGLLDVHELPEGAHVDGGDCLNTGCELLVGLSQRTNAAGVDALRALLPLPVTAIEVTGALHLKSLCSLLAPGVVGVSGCEHGARVAELVQRDAAHADELRWVPLPHAAAANAVLLLGARTLLARAEHKESLAIVSDEAARAGLNVVALEAGEVEKVDGALTCCSVIFDAAQRQ